MKKIIILIVLSVLLTLPVFSISTSEISKLLETFITNGNYVKIIEEKETLYILKQTIFGISVTDSKIFIVNSVNQKTIYFNNYDLSVDKNGNFIVTAKD